MTHDPTTPSTGTADADATIATAGAASTGTIKAAAADAGAVAVVDAAAATTGAAAAVDAAAADAGAVGAARDPAAKKGHPINWGVFGASAIIIAIVAAGAIISPSTVQDAFGAAVTWAGKWFGSFYIILITAALVFVVLVAVTRYGLVKLGPDNSTPDFSTFSWAAMLFA
ncbi:BCCT family transporter, partial [Actinomyces dentalis]|uniref:BCCT family transporter n=1 Tax=Actinomyces dentalis TaxID=272548 RepID=UPI0028F02426